MELEHERIIGMLEYPLPPISFFLFLSELVMHLKSAHA